MPEIEHILEDLKIAFAKHEHAPIFTVEEGLSVKEKISGGHTKNLFLRNKSGDTYYLVVIESSKRLDISSFQKQVQESKLSFASPEELQEKLGLTPGSVSPLGLIHNGKNDVIVIIDEDFLELEGINVHPNRNTATLTISIAGFQKFLDWTKNTYSFQKLPIK